MADEPDAPAEGAPVLAISPAGSGCVLLVISGELDTGQLRELEEHLGDPRLHEAHGWVVEMTGVRRLDLACAYALLRAATRGPQIAALTIRGARRTVARTLRHAGIDEIGTIEE